jgi:L-2,4-diaminobutyrate decarboxylase
MEKPKKPPIYSGATAEQVAEDLKPLADFGEEGLSLQELRQLMEKRLIPHLMNYDLSSFQSMFNAFPEEGARLGADVALHYNQGVTNWQVSPGGAMLEELCGKALCRLFGFSAGADATFMYCGTYANLQALHMALHRKAEREGFNLNQQGLLGFREPGRLAMLTSGDAHLSLKHAARTLGIGDNGIIPLDVDADRRIDVEKMKEKLEQLAGKKDIFCVVATAGTTSTGSVDPIGAIADICQERGIWLHVDGAYGFAYCLVPEKEHLYAGKERADSVSWDPHKQMGVPIPNSLLFVRKKDDFHRLTIFGDYFNPAEDPKPNPGLKSPPTTRPFSALPLVTSIRFQGKRKLIERLRAPLKAIEETAERIKGENGVESMHSPDTGILCFRITPADFPDDKLNELQEYVYERVLSEGRRTVSKTVLGQKTVLRLVAISPALTADNLMETVEYARSKAKDF